MSDPLSHGPVVLHLDTGLAIGPTGHTLLKRRDCIVLAALLRSPMGVSMDQLADLSYPHGRRPKHATDCVRQYVLRVRRALETCGVRDWIITDRAMGTVYHIAGAREALIADQLAATPTLAQSHA